MAGDRQGGLKWGVKGLAAAGAVLAAAACGDGATATAQLENQLPETQAPESEAPESEASETQALEDQGAEPQAADAAAAIEQHMALTAAPEPEGGWPADTAYGFSFDGLVAETIPLSAFQGEAVLVVNTASKCGFTKQYDGLQALYRDYEAKGLTIVGVPSNQFGGQEPGSAEEIAEFCRLNFGVTFPMAAKSDVIGEGAHPFYRWAESQLGAAAVPRWNFHKILVGPNGRAVAAFPSATTPESEELRAAIEAALAG